MFGDLKVWLFFGTWILLAVIAIAVGAMREALLRPRLGELRAYQAGTVMVCVVFLGVLWAVAPHLGVASAGQAWAIGAAWLVMTIMFEFGFGHFVAGHAWPKLLADYNVLAGRVWILVLVTTLAGLPIAVGLRDWLSR
jgi:hypothetical protein